MHLRRTFATAGTALLLFTACGDDDDTADDTTTTTEAEAEEETTTTAAEAGDGVNPEFAEYCAAVEELDQAEEFGTVEQFEAIRAVAPDEIRDELNTAIDIIVAGIESGNPEAVFDDPALQEAFGPIEAFEAENCGTEEEATGEIDPEFADYCALAIELDAQPSFPNEEQLVEIRDAAPEEIAEEAEIVVAGFLAALEAGTPEAAFDDPEVVENLDAIEAFDEEHCGLDHTDN
jgi:predicted Zn-dependent protease with MMP-like domain